MIVRFVVLSTLFLCLPSSAWVMQRSMSRDHKPMVGVEESAVEIGRRQVLASAVSLAGFALLTGPSRANALVKGVAPPAKKSAGDKPKCTNVEECQAMAAQREQESREQAEQAGIPPKVTSSGLRYLDFEEGTGDEAKDGDDVELYFKVLKLGKRSYDGLNGEGTVVFSRGA